MWRPTGGQLFVWLVIMTCGFLPLRGLSQTDTVVDQIYAVLILDSMTVTASQEDPDIISMIAQTVRDTTFYRAFQRLRRAEYVFSSELYFYKPEWVPHTFMRSLRVHRIRDGMRSNEVLQEKINRHMTNRKGEYKHYTAQMYDRVFFTHRPARVPSRWTEDVEDLRDPDSRMEKYVQDLKKLLFAPGSKIDLPLLGDKTAIFEEGMIDRYDFSLVLDTVSFPEPVYQFEIMAKPDLSEKETIIKEFTTVFDKKSKRVLQRSYRLAYNTILYSFDVSMLIKVRPTVQGDLPIHIEYRGWWNIPLKKSEWCRFVFKIKDY